MGAYIAKLPPFAPPSLSWLREAVHAPRVRTVPKMPIQEPDDFTAALKTNTRG